MCLEMFPKGEYIRKSRKKGKVKNKMQSHSKYLHLGLRIESQKT